MIFAYALLVVLGAMPLLFILYRIRKVNRLKKTGVQTMAIVREIETFSTRSINRVTIDYYMEDGLHYIRTQIKVAGTPYDIGQELPIVYDRKNPHQMQLDSGKGFILLVVFTAIIFIFSIVACFLVADTYKSGI